MPTMLMTQRSLRAGAAVAAPPAEGLDVGFEASALSPRIRASMAGGMVERANATKYWTRFSVAFRVTCVQIY